MDPMDICECVRSCIECSSTLNRCVDGYYGEYIPEWRPCCPECEHPFCEHEKIRFKPKNKETK